MASLPPVVEPVIDLAQLLQPISAERPAGVDLRYQNAPTGNRRNPKYWHDAIREAATEDLLAIEGARYADWPTVIALCADALSTHSKDLQIAAWLVEAHVKHDGFDQFAGLRDGLKLLHGLIETFWEGLYPAADLEEPDGHFTARANVLERLQNDLALAVKRIPLTQGELGLRYSFNQHESSKKYKITGLGDDAVAALRTQLEEDNKGTLTTEPHITDEDWAKAHQTTAYLHYAGRLQLLNECVVALNALDELMDEKFQRETPGLKNMTDALEEVQRQVRLFEEEKRPKETAPVNDDSAQQMDDDPGANGTVVAQGEARTSLAVPAGALRNRQEALKRLTEVAAYFRQTEPHTPVAFLVERAVRWGNMPFDKLLEELIKDGTELTRLRELLGLPIETEPSE